MTEAPTPVPPPRRRRKLLLLVVGIPALLLAAAGCHAIGVSRAIRRAEAQRPRNPETGIRIGAEPFAHDVGEPACLMLHGYAATPQMLREMAQRFADAGISSSAILLPGHGTTIADYAAQGKQEWIAAVEKAYTEMSGKYETVYVLGFSLGGTLALHLAEQRKLPGVICLAPFLRVSRKWFHVIRAESLTRFANWLGYPRVVENLPIDVADTSVRPRVIHAGFTPMAASCSLFDLADEVRANRSAIECPILVMHARVERVADPRESQRLIDQVSSTDKRLIYFERSKHLLPMDHDKETVFAEAIAFIKNRP